MPRLTCPPFTARYVRITALQYESASQSTVDEIQVFRARPPVSGPRPERVAIFKDASLKAGPGASSPDFLASLLEEAGLEPVLLGAAELASPASLNPASCPVLVLPYGEYFPVTAVENLRRYLMNGGSFFSTGGYAFNESYVPEGQKNELTATNWDLEQGQAGSEPEGWHIAGISALDTEVFHTGQQSLRVENPTEPMGGSQAALELPGLERGKQQSFRMKLWTKTEAIQGQGFAYIAVYQLDQQDNIVAWRDYVTLRGGDQWSGVAPEARDKDWREFSFVVDKAPAAERAELRVGLYQAKGKLWVDDISLEPFYQINTADGRVQDGLHFSDLQIGVFDPAFALKRVTEARALPGQNLLPPDFRLEGPLEGFAAVGYTGGDGPAGIRARWIPLVETYDRYGRVRGPLISMMHMYAGLYKDSTWAFSGVTNQDLFTAQQPELCEAFVSVVRHMLRGLFLSRVLPEPACVRQGQEASFKVLVTNSSWDEHAVDVELELANSAGKRIELQNQSVTLAPQSEQELTFNWAPERYEEDFYIAEVRLLSGSQSLDQASSGLTVWDPATLAKGLKLDYQDNYFEIEGRPQFLEGCKTASFYLDEIPQENPGYWEYMFSKMSDNGLNLYGVVGTDRTYDNFRDPAPKALGRLDSLVQTMVKHGVTPVFHLGYGPTTTGDWKANAEYDRKLAERYSEVPTLLAHLSGDIPLEVADNEVMNEAFRAFLKASYATDEALQQAWDSAEATLATASLEGYTYNTWPWNKAWDDVKARDVLLFAMGWCRAWHEEMAAGAREGNPDKNLLLTSEFWFQQILDQRNCGDMLDFSVTNVGLGDRETVFAYSPAYLAFSDLRNEGKSFTIGEFGAQVHPAFEGRGYSWETETGASQRYHLIAHHMFVMGGSMINDWDWQDLDYYTFPWGVVHEGDLADKDLLYTYRNLGVLYRYFQPAWQPPKVWCLLEDDHRYGGQYFKVTQHLMDALDLLSRSHVDFAVANSWKLDTVPKDAEVLFWPIPYSPSDETVARLKERVEAGATLIVTGDLSFGPEKRRTRQSRLEELCGVRFEAEAWPALQYPRDAEQQITASDGFTWQGAPAIRISLAGAKALASDEEGRPVVTEFALGQGKVLFSADPLCLHSTAKEKTRQAEGAKVYSWLLRQAGAPRLALSPDDPDVRVSTLPTKDGTEVVGLYNASDDRTITVRVDAFGHQASLTLPPLFPALIAYKEGKLVALEAHGEVTVDGVQVKQGEAFAGLLSLDGKALSASQAVLVLPFSSGHLQMAGSCSGWIAGELQAGKFAEYDRGSLGSSLLLDENLATCLVILANPETEAQAKQAVEALFPRVSK